MLTQCVYYCWSCDAHRRLEPAPDGTGHCPRCDETLAMDCRLRARVEVQEAAALLRIGGQTQHRPSAAA